VGFFVLPLWKKDLKVVKNYLLSYVFYVSGLGIYISGLGI